ncbi:FAS1-like dehydratase domain-containing protein [Parerythrobacter aestuarii]|uniref:FAS1-like dehydratase domain-containing protein n=1 Tax=Parerythrobacter aestuarii TaxID=3020909 RepID=UPI0024DE1E36|nr:MaoC family dehydratase N-terminal domain-containing protein [Parerythrobacter aestuarii]
MSWESWIGRKQVQQDTLGASLARRWLACFDLAAPDSGRMPQGIHLCLCTPEAATAKLGPDGHPARDDSEDSFFPPIPLPRRMWAASEISFLAPIRIGAKIGRISRIASVSEKEGSTGKLGFVEVEHVTTADHVEAVRETQTLVYRGDAAPDAPPSPPEPGDGSFDSAGWDFTRTLTPSETLLFRYSALTFNTHRIHYDLPYARDVERYRGLVVHGPLITSLLLQLAADEFGDNRLASFAFRAVSPAICGEPLTLALRQAGDSMELGSFASDGRQTLKATATLA